MYGKPQLGEVICQLRFPTILSISSKEPSNFQDKIRSGFPIYNLLNEELQIAVNQTIIPSFIQKPTTQNHNFISEDGKWKINLTNNFISLSTINYKTWEGLYEKFTQILSYFEDEYKPSYYDRIGLRYVNVISRKELNIEDQEWKNLINPCLIGVLSSVQEDKVSVSDYNAEYALEKGKYAIHIHAGFGTTNDNPEKKFIIDTDFFTLTKSEKENWSSVLDNLHGFSHSFISHAVTPILDQAMEPYELDE